MTIRRMPGYYRLPDREAPLERLSVGAEGAYQKLMRHALLTMPDQCSVPDDDQYLASILHLSTGEWEPLRQEIQLPAAPLLKGKRHRLVFVILEEEVLKYRRLSRTNTENAKRRWTSPSVLTPSAHATPQPPHSEGTAKAEPTQCSPPFPSPPLLPNRTGWPPAKRRVATALRC